MTLANLITLTTPEGGLNYYTYGAGHGVQLYTTGEPTKDELITALGVMVALGSPALFLTCCRGAGQ